MSEFYNKTTVESEWGTMLSLAKAYFESYNQKKYEYHQCLVLTTANSKQMICPITANNIKYTKCNTTKDCNRYSANYYCFEWLSLNISRILLGNPKERK